MRARGGGFEGLPRGGLVARPLVHARTCSAACGLLWLVATAVWFRLLPRCLYEPCARADPGGLVALECLLS